AEYLSMTPDSVFISTAAEPDGYTYPGNTHGDLFVAEFFSAIASDKNVEEAFDMAYDSTKVLHGPQEPMLFDVSDNAPTMSVGSWTIRGDMAPVVIDYAEGTTLADCGATPTTIDLWLEAEDDVMVSQAYALIMPSGIGGYEPGGEPFTGASTPIPVSLHRQVGGYWTGTYSIAGPGNYEVAYYVMDNVGNISELASTAWTMATLELELELNHYMFTPGDTVMVSVGYTNNSQTEVDVDFYLVVQLPNGGPLVFVSGFAGYTWGVASPYYSGALPPGHLDPTMLFTFTIPDAGLETGQYRWFAAFVEPGSEYTFMGDPAEAWMSIGS
ncbi:MAG: hypothetical protein JW941_12300, partial [Candidatus Coatesbacteria bacterium]|nr:hypothetical protein [Candidatus Coatesbacteria bacterium]